jgi:hypothetical protein
VIDLAGIDANGATAGDPAFAIVGAVTTGSAQLVLDTTTIAGSTIVTGYTNGDATADFEILVTGVTGLTSGDFSL